MAAAEPASFHPFLIERSTVNAVGVGRSAVWPSGQFSKPQEEGGVKSEKGEKARKMFLAAAILG
jgi:hypothetical protein